MKTIANDLANLRSLCARVGQSNQIGISILLLLVFVVPAQAQQLERDPDDSNVLRSSSIGDEAFTEPIETIKLAAAETGIIGRVHVQRGEEIQANDLVCELDMSVLLAARRLAQAKANSQARRTAAEVEFESKNKRYLKLVELLADQAGSPDEVERAKTNAEVARQNVEAIIEEIEQFALETKRIDAQLEQRRIRSPIAGVVTDVQKKPGEYVSNTDPQIATIVQLDTLRVVFYLTTSRANRIQRHDSAKLLLTETQQYATGVVHYVAPITNADSGRVRVEVLVANPQREFRSGVRCRLLETFTQQSQMEPNTIK